MNHTFSFMNHTAISPKFSTDRTLIKLLRILVILLASAVGRAAYKSDRAGPGI